MVNKMQSQIVVERFSEFFREYYYDEIIYAAQRDKRSLTIDFSTLEKFDIQLADQLLDMPEESLELAEEALKKIDSETKLRVRICNLPKERDIRIRALRAEHLGKLIAVDGIVKRASEIRPEVKEAIFLCLKCGSRISAIQTERIISPPAECDCGNRSGFKLVDQKLFDARWITVEEPYEVVSGERPSELMIYLKEDLTSPKMQNKTDPGNRIKVVGILKNLPRRLKGTRSRQMEIYLDANFVEPVEVEWEELEITPEDEKRIVELAKDPEVFQKLIASIAPSMYGMDDVKEAIILQLFGAEPKILPDKTKFRGNIHILLIGDPASGKSQIMQLASKLIPRGRYVSGSGITAAGITATVVRDEEFLGGWVLEAGALVMSNKSVCCLHPSSKIILNDKITEISNAFDEKRSEEVICNGELMDICELKAYTPSFNLDSLKISKQDIALVRRKKYTGKILNIELNSGYRLRLTPEHLLIDGDTFSWKKAEDFKEGEFILAPLRLPSRNERIFIFDLIPNNWKVCLSKEEKDEIKNAVLKKYRSVAEFNRKISLQKEILCGGCQPTLRQFRRIIEELGVVEEWKRKPLKFGRKSGSIKLRITEVTPELGYILGFVLGDGYLERKEGHCGIGITRSLKHKKYIRNFIDSWNKVFPEELHEYEDRRESEIRGRKISFASKVLYHGSNIILLLYDKLIGRDLENILSLPEDVLKGFVAGVFDSDGCIGIKKCKKKNKRYEVAHVEFLLSKNPEINLNFMLALRRLDVYSKLVKIDKNVDIIRITGRKDVVSLRNSISDYSAKINAEIPERMHKVSSSSDKLPKFIVAEICKKIIGEVNTSLLNKAGLGMIYSYINLKYQPSRDELEKALSRIENELSSEIRGRIEKLLRRDFFLDRIVKIESQDYSGFAYDLYVPKTNNFVADGVFVHNCIDEFSKVSPQDRVALQEAMSMETISIAKASIVATLPAQTAILAGGNPKLGRFDPYIPIREQIDIDDVLLSRFDLKFALRDLPNPELDAKIADHVLRMRKFEDEAKPLIEPQLLRKYIAYARTNVHPQLTEEAGNRIKEFYLEMRSKAGEEAPISITLRQYESLLRLAEASAKLRLSQTIDLEDAERAIRLMKVSLRQFGFEPETGRIDIDRAEGQRVTAAQRGKIRIMHDILEELTATIGKQIPAEELIKKAKESGVDNAEEILKKMLNEGICFSPKPGMIEKID